jgi:hypothetical protein
MNHRSRWALSFPKKDVVLKRNDSQEPDEIAGQKCGTADRQSEERKVEPGHGQVSRSITAVHPSDFQHAPLRLVPSRAANRLGQSSNDCGDNLYSSVIFGAGGTLLVSVCWATTTTVRWAPCGGDSPSIMTT